MTERQQQSYWSDERPAGEEASPPQATDVPPHQTVPGIPTPRVDDADDLTILGFPAVAGADDGDDRTPHGDAWGEQRPAVPEGGFDSQVRLVIVHRADPVAGLALVLAGVAAAVSLWLPWRQGKADTGLTLVWRGLGVAGSGVDELGRSGLWQPLAIVLGGGILLLLGVLLFLPAPTHRLVGVLALFVAAGAVAGVLFRVAQASWSAAQFDLGLWFAVAVGALGVLGALKAMLTTPRVRARPRRVARR
jgi:hypothetical protein